MAASIFDVLAPTVNKAAQTIDSVPQIRAELKQVGDEAAMAVKTQLTLQAISTLAIVGMLYINYLCYKRDTK